MRQQQEIDGRLVSYLDVRPTARQAGTVLLLHAFPLDAEMWRPQLAAAPSAWRFIAPDLRGFGQSSPDSVGTALPTGSEPLSIDDLALDVLALLDHLHVADPVVCGLSMGGYLAFALCRRAMSRLRGLVIADSRPDADSPAGRAGRLAQLETLASGGVAAIADGMLPRLLGATSRLSRPEVVEHVRSLIRSQRPSAVGAAIVRLMTRPDSTALLGRLGCPVLVIAGDEDEVTPPDLARQMHGQIVGAELALLHHAGHLSNLEQPAAFSAALDRFLATRFIQP